MSEKEIPQTKQGLINYMRYCSHEIDKMNRKRIYLSKMYKLCEEKLSKMEDTKNG